MPNNAKSLALIMIDIDPPIGKIISHWNIWNIHPETKEIPENPVLQGATVGRNMMRQNKYMGPCPPKGSHRYIFKLYALDTRLSLDSRANRKKLLKAMEGHILEECELMGSYKKFEKD